MQENKIFRIAIPIAQGKLCLHFGHCDFFAILDIQDKKIVKKEEIQAPSHQPGLLPAWLAEKGVNLVIAGGMGQRAQAIFHSHKIDVIIGAASETPEFLANQYIEGKLESGENICDH